MKSPTVVTNATAVELLRIGVIREILRSPGPCITILLPPYRPGEPAAPPAALLKTYIQHTVGQLSERRSPKLATANLLRPLERLAEDPALEAGSHWSRAIFLSSSVFQQFYLTNAVAASLSVAGSYSIRRLAPELSRPRESYTLALSKTQVALLRCTGLHAEVAKLPPGVPETLAEALALEPPDHDLEGRSAVGASTGAMHSVRFGTGSGRERQHAHLADYYRLVDRGLQRSFREPNIPLILAGVEEDVAIYRGGSTYRGLAKSSIPGSRDVVREQIEMLQQAYSILRADEIERQHAVLLAAKEQAAASRFSADPDAILRAAFEGQVGELYLNEHRKNRRFRTRIVSELGAGRFAEPGCRADHYSPWQCLPTSVPNDAGWIAGCRNHALLNHRNGRAYVELRCWKECWRRSISRRNGLGAVNHAGALARRFHSEITLFHAREFLVIDSLTSSLGVGTTSTEAERLRRQQKQLDEFGIATLVGPSSARATLRRSR